ncbi:MAG: 2Fe-2S iron-sulfur cluster-binding protein [Gaiellaceae bacterium]
MNAPESQIRELVTVTVDGRQARVPKGSGLVEAAASVGIEIPVFCYEPRIGAGIGACRMCLVEIEGMPKLQTGCTTPVTDGMVVHTGASSEAVAVAQNATIEFLLLNHPLDCPVCDKGGECPLQDLSFRYGPGTTRMTFHKRSFEKPVPISPTIAIDRERCIMCFRCTRFSQEVAEDEELSAVNRGALSMIATFADEPYRGPFSGNVVELCPVGALTSTQYRFKARPWEYEQAASVCGLCAVGCNVAVQSREGKVQRVLSRNHPEIDRGWLCDKGRFSYPHLYSEERILTPRRRGVRELEELGWEQALDELEGMIERAQGEVVLALSGSETLELAYSLARVVRQGAGSDRVVLPEQVSDCLDPFRVPISALAEAEEIVVLEDCPVLDRAPLIELWLKQARRNGARVTRIGPSGDIQRAHGEAALVCQELAEKESALGKRLRAAKRVVLLWSGSGGAGGCHLAALAGSLGLQEKEGSGALLLPASPNARGVAEAWAAAGEENRQPRQIGLLLVSGDAAASDPQVRQLAEHARATVALTLFAGDSGEWADLVLPATSYLERSGTMRNLEGRLQRLRGATGSPVRSELSWLVELAGRLGMELPSSEAALFAELSAKALDGVSLASLGDRAPLPPQGENKPFEGAPAEAPPILLGGPLELIRYRALFSGPEVEHVAELSFQRAAAEVEISPEDADRRGIKAGDEVVVRSNGTRVTLGARINPALLPGAVRIAAEHCAELARGVEVSRP